VEVLNTLKDMNSSWVVDLHDAVAAYCDYNSKLRVDQSYQLTMGEGTPGVGCSACSSELCSRRVRGTGRAQRQIGNCAW
jgi:hypothetical protein